MPSDYTLRSYKRTHKDAHPEDSERGKIKRETVTYAGSAQRRAALERRLVEDPESEALAEELAQVETRGERIRRNAQTHKRRLKKLKQQGLD